MKTALFLLLAAISAPAAAQSEIRCDPAGNQIELNQCAADDLALADDELNQVYRQVVAALAERPVAIVQLRASQRLWIQLRDADLQALFPLEQGEDPRYAYGSMYPLSHASAKADLTRARTQWLRRNFLENDG
jgi:uncharacterized protein YecT (DUF1311 family)